MADRTMGRVPTHIFLMACVSVASGQLQLPVNWTRNAKIPFVGGNDNSGGLLYVCSGAYGTGGLSGPAFWAGKWVNTAWNWCNVGIGGTEDLSSPFYVLESDPALNFNWTELGGTLPQDALPIVSDTVRGSEIWVCRTNLTVARGIHPGWANGSLSLGGAAVPCTTSWGGNMYTRPAAFSSLLYGFLPTPNPSASATS
jgi:hypothetical protein